MKRFFLVPVITLNVLAFLHSLWNIIQNPNTFAWWGAAIATVPMPLFIAFLFLRKKGRVSAKYYDGLAVALIGLFISLLYYSQLLPVLYAGLLGVLGILLYDFWYTPFHRENHADIKVGKKLPAFTLKNLLGEKEKSKYWEGTPFFLIFVRGNWCPLCVGQISEIAAIYKKIASRGVDIKVVAAQTEEKTRKLAERFDVPIQFYIDENNAASKKLKIVHEYGVSLGILGYEVDTYYPTVILVNAQQEIVYIDLTDNYRVRPEPKILLNASIQHL